MGTGSGLFSTLVASWISARASYASCASRSEAHLHRLRCRRCTVAAWQSAQRSAVQRNKVVSESRLHSPQAILSKVRVQNPKIIQAFPSSALIISKLWAWHPFSHFTLDSHSECPVASWCWHVLRAPVVLGWPRPRRPLHDASAAEAQGWAVGSSRVIDESYGRRKILCI